MGIGEDKIRPLRETAAHYIHEHWDDEFKRPEALLTDKQRRFVYGIFKYTGEDARQRRYAMRERIRRRFADGIRDLGLLHELDGNSREKIADDLGGSELHSGAADLLEYVYMQTGDRSLVEKIVETAVFGAEGDDPELGGSTVAPTSVTVDISTEYPPDLDALQERYKDRGLSALQPEEIGLLIKDLRLDPDDLSRYYQNQVGDSDLFDGVENVAEKYPHFEEPGDENKDVE